MSADRPASSLINSDSPTGTEQSRGLAVSWPWIILTFFTFLLAALAVHVKGFQSPMIYDSQAWIADKIHVFAQHSLTDVIAIVPVRPLFMLTLYANYLLTGMEPVFFRVTNAVILALAGAALALLYVVLFSMEGRSGPAIDSRRTAAALALVFVVHPLQSFVVLYIWQREAIMACLFYYSCFALYLAARHGYLNRAKTAYCLCSALFLCGLFSKENLVTLPIMMFLAEIILFRASVRLLARRAASIALITVPPVLIYLAVTPWFYGTQTVHPGGVLSRLAEHFHDSGLTPLEASMTAARILFSYVFMILAPSAQGLDLIRAERISRSLWNPPETLVACIGLALLATLAIILARRRPLTSFGILFFLVTPLPESLLIPQFLFFGYRPILPMAGLLIIAGDMVQLAVGKLGPKIRRGTLNACMAAALACAVGWLGFLTVRQAERWEPLRFWKTAYERLPAWSPDVETNPYVTVLLSYGRELATRREYSHATYVLTRAVDIVCRSDRVGRSGSASPKPGRGWDDLPDTARLAPCSEMKPDYYSTYNYLGMAMAGLGFTDRAAEMYRYAMALKPDSAEAYCNLAQIKLIAGEISDAEALCRQAIGVNGEFAPAYNTLGEALMRQSRPHDAPVMFETAIRLNPEYAAAYNNLGNAKLALGEPEEAAKTYSKGIRVRPDSAELHNNLGAALLRLNRIGEAKESFANAVSLKPSFAKAHANLGMVCLATGDAGRGIEHLKKALELMPDLTEARRQLEKALDQAAGRPQDHPTQERTGTQ